LPNVDFRLPIASVVALLLLSRLRRRDRQRRDKNGYPASSKNYAGVNAEASTILKWTSRCSDTVDTSIYAVYNPFSRFMIIDKEKHCVGISCLGVILAVSILPVVYGARGADGLRFFPGRKVGTVESSLINECSGIAASRKNPGVLWVHNDDGPPCVYAVSPQGKHLGTYNLDGVRMRDWEDISVGPGPEPNVDYLYVGAIGDNSSKRKSIEVYRVPEPAVVQPFDTTQGGQSSPQVDANQAGAIVKVGGVETIELVYPDGPRDAETLLVDPLTRDLYIISKEEPSRVYRAAYPQLITGKTTLEYVARMPWGTATGGDISGDGRMIIIRNYFAASVWLRPKDGPLWRAFGNNECKVPLIVEPQGEAICFDANGAGYYTTSEHRRQPIYYFPMNRQNGK